MRFLKQLVAVAVVGFAGGAAVTAVQGNALLTLVLGVATAVLTLFVYARVVRWTERKAAADVAGKGAAASLGLGTLAGVGLFTAVVVNIAFLGGYRVDGAGSVAGPVALLGFMAGAAVTEEVLFRGVLFRIVEERIGTWSALALTTVPFGLWHLGNANAGLWGVAAIMIGAGPMLAAAYAATRTLWLPIGLHFGWNFAAAGIFGTEVSGNGETEGMLDGATSGSVLVSGGEFGPEASLYAVGFCVLATVVFAWIAHRRGLVVGRKRPVQAAATATLAK